MEALYESDKKVFKALGSYKYTKYRAIFTLENLEYRAVDLRVLKLLERSRLWNQYSRHVGGRMKRPKTGLVECGQNRYAL